jgi:predicted hydrolase (HD superfamily)
MMDYESLARNRPPADALRRRIMRQVQRGRGPYDGRLPQESELNALADEWLPRGAIQAGFPAEGRTWEDLTLHRKTSDYWREHCQTVARMMEGLGVLFGQEKRLWRTAGLVHDLDFLIGPHFDDEIDPGQAHPTAISAELLEMGVAPVLVLAILEHSPHLRLAPTSPLSHALILCDEHATMTSAGQRPDYGPDAVPAIVNCLTDGKPIAGFTRPDMQDRASRAMAALAPLYRAEDRSRVASAFNPEGWAP